MVLVNPRAVTRGPPTVGPMKLPRAKAEVFVQCDNEHDYDAVVVNDNDVLSC